MSFLLKVLPTLFSSPLVRNVIGGMANHTLSGMKKGLTTGLKSIIDHVEGPPQNKRRAPTYLPNDEDDWDDEEIEWKRSPRRSKKVRRY